MSRFDPHKGHWVPTGWDRVKRAVRVVVVTLALIGFADIFVQGVSHGDIRLVKSALSLIVHGDINHWKETDLATEKETTP